MSAAETTVLEPGGGNYPQRLIDLNDPPRSLWVSGKIPVEPAAAIVGARSADAAGLSFARALAMGLARAGVVVVSGGARGIDQAAHTGALDGGGKTIMVLGCGLEVDYPRGSETLRRGVATTGAVVTELPPDTTPRPAHFPRRNRIIAALAEVVVVVQGGERSGALITARLAKALGRPVLAVPGRPGAPLTRAPHGLLRNGAGLVEHAADVLACMGLECPDDGVLRELGPTIRLTGLGAKIVRQLNRGPASVDELSRGLDWSVGEVLSGLVELEMDGVVTSRGGCL